MIKNLNLSDTELDSNIYRIIPYDRFMINLENNENVLVRPKLWDDPFENILSMQSNNRRFVNDKYFIYAQCWTFSKENDLLWRAYSPNMDSIKLRTTPRKLINSISNSKRIFEIKSNPRMLIDFEDEKLEEGIDGFIGKVKYLSKNRITDCLKKMFDSYDHKNYYETFLLKRLAFRSENELRLGVSYFFAYDDIQMILSDDFFKYDVAISDLIDEIVFDPRISDFKYNALKNQIRQYGYNKSIIKSSLYKIPDMNKMLKEKRRLTPAKPQ